MNLSRYGPALALAGAMLFSLPQPSASQETYPCEGCQNQGPDQVCMPDAPMGQYEECVQFFFEPFGNVYCNVHGTLCPEFSLTSVEVLKDVTLVGTLVAPPGAQLPLDEDLIHACNGALLAPVREVKRTKTIIFE